MLNITNNLVVFFFRVSDRYSFDPDPDPAFEAEYRIRIQGFDDQNYKNFTAEKKFNIFKIKNCNLSIFRLPERASKLQKKPQAIKREHPALQNMKFLILSIFFVGHFCPPISGSGFRIWNRIHWLDWIRIQSETLIFSFLFSCRWESVLWYAMAWSSTCGRYLWWRSQRPSVRHGIGASSTLSRYRLAWTS